MDWIVLLYRIPAGPSRHRVAVWRELRRLGAVSLGQAAWLLPDTPLFDAHIERVLQLLTAADGEVLTLKSQGRSEADRDRLAGEYTAAREAEWTEFLSECDKYIGEVQREIATRKFTLAELDEEEQSLDRLRHWYRELRARDVLQTDAADAASQQLKACEEHLDDFARLVFREAGPR